MRADSRLASIFPAVVSLGLAGCALLAPLPRETTLQQRLAAIPTHAAPVSGPVTIHWNDRQVPFIEAETDAGAAFALGMTHAHLRLGQMEIFRRISQGRVSEMGGPLATDIDHGLRLIGFGRAAEAMERALPPATRAWLENFVAGINHYLENVEELPPEFALLGLAREKWRIRDVLTFGRLAGTDVNWLVWMNALPLRKRADWKALWAKLVKNGGASLPSFANDGDLGALGRLLSGSGKTDSNSLAIGPDRTTTGAAIMANDPHLGITLPNLWMIIGLKSPSFHAVGLMAPGLPIFAIGRNPWISWGGTNMRAASSDLLDLTDVDKKEITERRETIRVRWWFDRDIPIRETRWGPILSDAPMLKNMDGPDYALRWTGHAPSDEISAMLAVSRARDFDEFRSAFRSFAVPGQNMLYADHAGHVGQVMAVRLPARTGDAPADILTPPREADAAWRRTVGVMELPFSLDPAPGYVVSANNRPTKTDVAIGHFFSPDDRVERMRRIIDDTGRLGIDDVMALQRDVVMPSSRRLSAFYLARLKPLAPTATETERAAIQRIEQWDGIYGAASRGAIAFELFHASFAKSFYEAAMGRDDAARYTAMSRLPALIEEDIASADAAPVEAALRTALAEKARGLAEFDRWGDMHRLAMSHPLSFLPLLGSRYRFTDLPAGGGSQTLMKTAHRLTTARHATRYGSTARHISDMSDMDRNYFVLLGGQDGWLNSSNFLDQLDPWRRGKYIEMPLRMKTVRETFAHRTILAP